MFCPAASPVQGMSSGVGRRPALVQGYAKPLVPLDFSRNADSRAVFGKRAARRPAQPLQPQGRGPNLRTLHMNHDEEMETTILPAVRGSLLGCPMVVSWIVRRLEATMDTKEREEWVRNRA